MKTNIRCIKYVLLLATISWPGIFASRSAGGAQTLKAPTSEGVEFFEKKIRPVLIESCYGCHSAQSKKPQGGLLLDSREALLRGGASGQPAIAPGDPDKSLLIRAIRHTDPKLQMPLGGKLPEAVIRDFEEWVKMGAPDPRGATAPDAAWRPYDFDEAKKFWSFQPVKDYAPPQVKNEAWARTPVDRFVLAKLEEKGLKPAAEADRRTLIRRATFDLTGLPPTPREIDDFLQDQSPNAFEKVVDRLLASPAYGERWGRHWLDLARYADTAGCNSDFPAPQAYKYRNYVINAFNRDKPYDQFIREQIAGDLLPHKNEEEWKEGVIATGYIAISRRFGSRDTDQNLTIDDTIDNLGKTFLGLTTSCARCHDHKFDPIPQRDYYALYGIFKSTRYPFPGAEIYPHPHSLVPLVTGKEAERLENYQKEISQLDLRKEALQVELGFARGRRRAKEAAPEALAESAGKTIKTDQIGRVVAVDKLIEEDHDDRNRQMAETSTRAVEQIEEELNKVKLRLAEIGDAPNVERAYAVAEGAPGDARIHRKGDNKNLGDEARRGFLQILGGQRLPDGYRGSGRLELAKWLSDANNPLTARVMVNRNFPPKAKRVIFMLMSGGVSHLDTFDPKPKLVAAAEKKGLGANNRPLLRPMWDFKPNRRCGVEVSDLFPHLREVMDEVCLIRSMKCDHNEHFQATLGVHTGSVTFKRPSIGSWVSYGLGTENRNLPSFIVLAPYLPYAGSQVWSSDFLPAAHQGVRLIPGAEPAQDLTRRSLSDDIQRRELGLLADLNRQHLLNRENESVLTARIKSFETAFGMQREMPEALDLSQETDATLKLYGLERGSTKGFAWQCLVARLFQWPRGASISSSLTAISGARTPRTPSRAALMIASQAML